MQDNTHCTISCSHNFQSADKKNTHCSKQHKGNRGHWEQKGGVPLNESFREGHSTHFYEMPVLLNQGPSTTEMLKSGIPVKIHQTRARTKAEKALEPAWNQDTTAHSACRARLYTREEDGLLQNLVAQGLSWNEIEALFSQHFTGRSSRSLQMRWSRNLKFALPSLSTRRSKH